MNEFKVELFVANDDEHEVILSSLNEDEIVKWSGNVSKRQRKSSLTLPYGTRHKLSKLTLPNTEYNFL